MCYCSDCRLLFIWKSGGGDVPANKEIIVHFLNVTSEYRPEETKYRYNQFIIFLVALIRKRKKWNCRPEVVKYRICFVSQLFSTGGGEGRDNKRIFVILFYGTGGGEVPGLFRFSNLSTGGGEGREKIDTRNTVLWNRRRRSTGLC